MQVCARKKQKHSKRNTEETKNKEPQNSSFLENKTNQPTRKKKTKKQRGERARAQKRVFLSRFDLASSM
jgi:hypothetical protein